jgi:hypothetical protein
MNGSAYQWLAQFSTANVAKVVAHKIERRQARIDSHRIMHVRGASIKNAIVGQSQSLQERVHAQGGAQKRGTETANLVVA